MPLIPSSIWLTTCVDFLLHKVTASLQLPHNVLYLLPNNNDKVSSHT